MNGSLPAVIIETIWEPINRRKDVRYWYPIKQPQQQQPWMLGRGCWDLNCFWSDGDCRACRDIYGCVWCSPWCWCQTALHLNPARRAVCQAVVWTDPVSVIVDGLGTSVNTAREDSSEYLHALTRTDYSSGGTWKHVASECVSNSPIMDAHLGKKGMKLSLDAMPFPKLLICTI